jgi:membrane protein YqaA with SNARE-associated domain
MLDALIHFFTQWGYLGLFLGSFLAGSIVPFSSEALVIACVGPLHMNPLSCLLVALAGNVSGGMTCYYIGHLGKIEWIEKYARVSEEKLNKALKFMKNRGAWMGFFAFIPILGTAISVALGYVRSNPWIVLVTMTIGKLLRYAAIIWGSLKLIDVLTFLPI